MALHIRSLDAALDPPEWFGMYTALSLPFYTFGQSMKCHQAASDDSESVSGGVTPDAKNVPIPLLRREVTPPPADKVRDHQVSFIGPVEGAARQARI